MYLFWTYLGNYSTSPIFVDTGGKTWPEDKVKAAIRSAYAIFADEWRRKATIHVFGAHRLKSGALATHEQYHGTEVWNFDEELVES